MNKKFILSLITLMAGFVLVACGGSNDGASDGQDKLEEIKASGELIVGTSPDFPPMEFYI